ncbi:hypothetical protein E4T56_gene16216 [Termitomyces sp. T112]|nr:hypothetical protein E4T56_gene16216 [Termitomyces sp. T112]
MGLSTAAFVTNIPFASSISGDSSVIGFVTAISGNPPPTSQTPDLTTVTLTSSETFIRTIPNESPSIEASSAIFVTTTIQTLSTTTAVVTSSFTTLVVSTNSSGRLVTQTSVVLFTSTLTLPPASSTASDSGSSNGFFQNTGAVAGTFTVVGLVGLIVLGLLIFVVGMIIHRHCCQRRRRRRSLIRLG